MLLHVDHIHPKSQGGVDDITNLVTSCESCNLGKSDIALSDDSAIAKRKAQLDKLQERREQLDLMFQWHQELLEIQHEAVDRVSGYFLKACGGRRDLAIQPGGRAALQKAIKKFGVSEVLVAIDEAVKVYCKASPKTGEMELGSIQSAFDKIGPICAVRRQSTTEPYLKALYYIRGILRNRLGGTAGYSEWKCLDVLRNAAKRIGAEYIQDLATRSNSWRQFVSDLELLVQDHATD